QSVLQNQLSATAVRWTNGAAENRVEAVSCQDNGSANLAEASNQPVARRPWPLIHRARILGRALRPCSDEITFVNPPSPPRLFLGGVRRRIHLVPLVAVLDDIQDFAGFDEPQYETVASRRIDDDGAARHPNRASSLRVCRRCEQRAGHEYSGRTREQSRDSHLIDRGDALALVESVCGFVCPAPVPLSAVRPVVRSKVAMKRPLPCAPWSPGPVKEPVTIRPVPPLLIRTV